MNNNKKNSNGNNDNNRNNSKESEIEVLTEREFKRRYASLLSKEDLNRFDSFREHTYRIIENERASYIKSIPLSRRIILFLSRKDITSINELSAESRLLWETYCNGVAALDTLLSFNGCEKEISRIDKVVCDYTAMLKKLQFEKDEYEKNIKNSSKKKLKRIISWN